MEETVRRAKKRERKVRLLLKASWVMFVVLWIATNGSEAGSEGKKDEGISRQRTLINFFFPFLFPIAFEVLDLVPAPDSNAFLASFVLVAILEFFNPPAAFDLLALCKDLKFTHCFSCLMKSAPSDTPPMLATI
ncbi:hypothetical protein BUALT_Bualt06G0017600 [Buddleja alternifolia]|uniref:Uncharacterized protein n=1 Tax=Buddleja alternifolia TaxID=168488 RepID=A0AAV6XC79_9LAMI|nr:hypothetical protein BUALT_Bualt06G0017600 [Buddleja alternifolia]